MTTWNMLTAGGRAALMIFAFAVICVQIFYLIRDFEHRRSPLWICSFVWACLSLAALCIIYDTKAGDRLPVSVPAAVIAASAAGITATLAYSERKNRRRITRSSIKEAMDDLPAGGCYFTAGGRVKLCNRRMYRLFYDMTGRDLRTLDEFLSALDKCGERGVAKTHDGGYLFPDGRVWYCTLRENPASDGRRYTEAVLTDATELSAANEELVGDTAELARINRKLEKMYARAEDRIREREYLTFKMKIHDSIGRSLAIIRRVLGDEAEESADIEKQINDLSLAVETLVYSPDRNSDDPYDALLGEAAELGVDVRLNGMLPMEPQIYELTVGAVKECVTNCVRHAHGTAVSVRISPEPGGYTVTITNDGEPPRGKITEGGGLSNLRRRVENAGGEMLVSHYPEFVLRLTLMREEMEL